MVRRRIKGRSKETSQIAVVTGSMQKIGDNLKNIRYEASRHFTKNKKDYLKDKINELVANSKNKSIRDCVEK
jgi:hypothetical protein